MLLNLHTHLEGRVRPATALELGARLGLPVPAGGWEEALQLEGPSNLTVYLEKVSSTYPFFSDRDCLTRIAREAVEDAAADGEDYLELRFGPMSHVGRGMDLDDVIAAVCEGISAGDAGDRCGIGRCGLRAAAPRSRDEHRRRPRRGAFCRARGGRLRSGRR